MLRQARPQVGIAFAGRELRLLVTHCGNGRLEWVARGSQRLPGLVAGGATASLPGLPGDTVLAEVLRAAAEEAACVDLPLILSLPAAHSLLHTFEVPRMSERELQETVRWEMAQRLPAPDAMAIDFLTSPPACGTGRRRVCVLAAPRVELERVRSACRAAGLRLIAVEPHATALCRGIRAWSGGRLGDEERYIALELDGPGGQLTLARGSQPAAQRLIGPAAGTAGSPYPGWADAPPGGDTHDVARLLDATWQALDSLFRASPAPATPPPVYFCAEQAWPGQMDMLQEYVVERWLQRGGELAGAPRIRAAPRDPSGNPGLAGVQAGELACLGASLWGWC